MEPEGLTLFQMVLVYFGYAMMYTCGIMWETLYSIQSFFSFKKPDPKQQVPTQPHHLSLSKLIIIY